MKIRYQFVFDHFPTFAEVEERMMLELVKLHVRHADMTVILGIGKSSVSRRLDDLRVKGLIGPRKVRVDKGKVRGQAKSLR
jgi:predicted transcriptional regulator